MQSNQEFKNTEHTNEAGRETDRGWKMEEKKGRTGTGFSVVQWTGDRRSLALGEKMRARRWRWRCTEKEAGEEYTLLFIREGK